MSDVVAPARPAATVVLCRAGNNGTLEFFLVKRHGRAGFMAGAHVFPGGRVDDDDATLGEELPAVARAHARALVPAVPVEMALGFCVAAIRETAEECGLVLARDAGGALVTSSVAGLVVDDMARGRSFGDALTERGLRPDVEALHPLAWWITPAAEPKRFDTRFFLAAAPLDQAPRVDAQEATEGAWFRPDEALHAYRSGTLRLAPPTLATLEDLLGADTIDDARATASLPLTPIDPELIYVDDGGMLLALPGDPLHSRPLARAPHRTRFVLDGDGRFSSYVVR